MDQSTLTAELELAVRLADLAAAISVPAALQGGTRASFKSDATPVTEIDLEVEAVIREALTAERPTDGFLGEESGQTGEGSRLWVVDPIDGTKNLVDGLPMWSTLIALVEDGTPTVGVVDVPLLGERYTAVRGAGAFLNGSQIHVSQVDRMEDALLLHSSVEEWLDGEHWEAFLSAVRSCRRTRGVADAWGHMLVARGAAEAVLEHEPAGVWDWTAPQVILEEAGGLVTTLDGEPPTPGCMLLTSSAAIHPAILASLHEGQRR